MRNENLLERPPPWENDFSAMKKASPGGSATRITGIPCEGERHQRHVCVGRHESKTLLANVAPVLITRHQRRKLLFIEQDEPRSGGHTSELQSPLPLVC